MSEPKVLAIQNCEFEGFGEFEKYIVERGLGYETIHPYRDNTFPDPENYGAILIGGTPLSANDIDKYPFLRSEAAFLEATIKHDKGCLGICFGAQILAVVLGAAVSECRPKEIGVYRIRLTDSGRDDPLLKGFPDDFPAFQWHGDRFDIPLGGSLLAQGDICRNQMFRSGKVAGVQFHLETSCREAGFWADAYAKELADFGKSVEQLIEECQASEPVRLALADRLIENFLANLI